MDEIFLFKAIAVAMTALFVYYGMDIRHKKGTQNFVAPHWLILMKLCSFMLIGAFVWFMLATNSIGVIDWLSLALMSSGTALILAAKRALGTAHTFTGQHLEKPSLVTHGVYTFTRNPLYFGVFQCEVGASVFALNQAPGILPDSYLYWLSALTAALLYAVVFNWKMAKREACFLESHFGDAYRKWSAVTPFLVPFTSVRKGSQQ